LKKTVAFSLLFDRTYQTQWKHWVFHLELEHISYPENAYIVAKIQDDERHYPEFRKTVVIS